MLIRVCNRCKDNAAAEVPTDWSRFIWEGVEFDLCPECASDTQTFLSDVEAFSHVEDNECPLHVRCQTHEFFHGAEATELREGIERILEDRDFQEASDLCNQLQRLLEKVDARDSLAYSEMIEKEKKNALVPRH